MKTLTLITAASVMSLGACAPTANVGHLQPASHAAEQLPSTVKPQEKTEVSVSFKFKSGRVISFTF